MAEKLAERGHGGKKFPREAHTVNKNFNPFWLGTVLGLRSSDESETSKEIICEVSF